MKAISFCFLILAVLVASLNIAWAQPDAGAKARGEYNFYGSAAGRSMRSAYGHSRDFRQYAQSAPKANPEVAKEAVDSIGQYISKAQKHMAWMRKQATGDKAALASLDSIDKHLADAAKAHANMCEMCLKENVDTLGSMKCCEELEASLGKAIAEHDKLMKPHAGEKAATPKK